MNVRITTGNQDIYQELVEAATEYAEQPSYLLFSALCDGIEYLAIEENKMMKDITLAIKDDAEYGAHDLSLNDLVDDIHEFFLTVWEA